MSPLTLHFDQTSRNGTPVRTAAFSDGASPLVWEFPGTADLPEPEVLDGPLFAALFYAMREDRTFRIDGPVSRRALRNARQFMEAWACMKPDLYRVVDIEPERVVEAVRLRPEAVSAFSGGMDAMFTALRHADPSAAAYNLETVVMVHGFDVLPEDYEGFDRLRRRVAPFLDRLGLETLVVRAIKNDAMQRWIDSFGSQLAGALHHFSHRFGYGLLGSSEPYSHLVMGIGSTPATDYLLSGDAMEIVHDGAGFSRTEKAERLARDPLAIASVKVCWEGGAADRNCGRCEKCLRTRMNFLAVGVPDPGAFEGPFDIDAIGTLNVEGPFLTELVTIHEYARRKGLTEPWVDRLETKLRELRPGK